MALKLYEAAEALNILDDLLEEYAPQIEAAGGDIEAVPEIAELLAFAEGDFHAAVERWGLKIRALTVEAEAAKTEAVRLAVIQRTKENAAKRLKDYLLRQMEARGEKKIASPLVTVRIQKNSQPSVFCASDLVIEELYAQGSDLVVRKETFALDREAVLKAQENGEALPEGVVVQIGSHVRVA